MHYPKPFRKIKLQTNLCLSQEALLLVVYVGQFRNFLRCCMGNVTVNLQKFNTHMNWEKVKHYFKGLY